MIYGRQVSKRTIKVGCPLGLVVGRVEPLTISIAAKIKLLEKHLTLTRNWIGARHGQYSNKELVARVGERLQQEPTPESLGLYSNYASRPGGKVERLTASQFKPCLDRWIALWRDMCRLEHWWKGGPDAQRLEVRS